MDQSSTPIPPEVWLLICEHSTPHGLTSIARLSKTFHTLATLALYQEITIDTDLQAYGCCRTLATSHYNLAGIVHDFRINIDYLSQLDSDQRLDFREWFVRAVTRMTSLESYQCWLPIAIIPHIAYALSNITTIKDIRFCLPPRVEMVQDELPVLEELDPFFPTLHTFGLLANEPRPITFQYRWFVQRLLRKHRTQLRHLRYLSSLDSPDILETILSDSDTLPALQSFHISSSLLNPSTLWRIPHIRRLNCAYDLDFTSPVPRHVLRQLEEYAGPSRCLPELCRFPRPLSTLHLDVDAFVVEDLIQANEVTLNDDELRPLWPMLLSHIREITKSTGPVRVLSLHLLAMDFGDFPQAIPYLGTLESLTVYFKNHPTQVCSSVSLPQTADKCFMRKDSQTRRSRSYFPISNTPSSYLPIERRKDGCGATFYLC